MSRRYPIVLGLTWKLFRRAALIDSGFGRTVNLSTQGILFDAMGPFPTGMKIALSIFWPMGPANLTPACLDIEGRIVRSNGCNVAITIDRHNFCTASR